MVAEGQDRPISLVQMNPILAIAHAMETASGSINLDQVKHFLDLNGSPDFAIWLRTLSIKIHVVNHQVGRHLPPPPGAMPSTLSFERQQGRCRRTALPESQGCSLEAQSGEVVYA